MIMFNKVHLVELVIAGDDVKAVATLLKNFTNFTT